MRARQEPKALLAVVLIAVAFSGVGPRLYGTWLLEATPVAVGCVILVVTYSRFQFTPLVYRALAFGALWIALGAHYSYADALPGEWLQAWLRLDRNSYDRIGHVAQGALSALVIRELLLRVSRSRRGWWLTIVVTSASLGTSAGFELIEAFAASVTGRVGTVYLGTQGDPLDAEWDMLRALAGAVLSQLLLRQAHDRQIETTTAAAV
ncbi:DUF2238 domain-containing protein [Kibdelosporangium aridum]|uniref:DUF2238 domain-containing protein n=1 Tax=Kibdelosporangium aridum TaxID=2030 RepID=A0A428ZAX9_KIBAR|nr:DUF2238 domain-containing protein [Kibdelosporangium aridum]RSM85237.1 DUF2238 domain-containing protein [Kibdelosporangium aridum]